MTTHATHGRAALSMVAIALAALGLTLVGGGSGERSPGETAEALILPEVAGEAPTEERLIGTWREERESGAAFVRFDRDGTFAVDTDALDAPYYAVDTYQLERGTIAFVSNGPNCVASWEWRVCIRSDGSRVADELHVVFANAWCQQLRDSEHTFARE